jgi:protein-S-isoprenylcysteine O-methyltransferase Ste14
VKKRASEILYIALQHKNPKCYKPNQKQLSLKALEMSSEEEREVRFQEAAGPASQNALVWCGFGLTNFVLIVSIFTVFSVKTNTLFEIAISLFLLSGVLCCMGWAIYGTITNMKVGRVKDRKTGEIKTNALYSLSRQADGLLAGGTVVYFAGQFLLLAFLELYLVLAILVVPIMVGISYTIYTYYRFGT